MFVSAFCLGENARPTEVSQHRRQSIQLDINQERPTAHKYQSLLLYICFLLLLWLRRVRRYRLYLFAPAAAQPLQTYQVELHGTMEIVCDAPPHTHTTLLAQKCFPSSSLPSLRYHIQGCLHFSLRDTLTGEGKSIDPRRRATRGVSDIETPAGPPSKKKKKFVIPLKVRKLESDVYNICAGAKQRQEERERERTRRLNYAQISNKTGWASHRPT